MFRWRDALEVNCITEKGAQCEGLWYVRSSGFMSGKEVFLQVGSSLLEDRYHPKTQGTQRHAVMPSVLALDLLKSRVLTMVGAMDDAVYLKRLNTVSTGLPYKTIPTWYAYGPFLVEPNSINEFGQQFPGEEQAIRGDMNPNITYQLKPTDTNYNYRAVLEETKKRTFDFRQQVFSDEEGWVNLTEALKLEGRSSFCYLMYQWEEEKAHEAVFSFTFPTRAVVYLNGERVMTTFRSQAYNPGAVPKEINDMSIRLPLKAGENALTIKLATLPQAWNGIDWPQRMAVTRAVEGISLEDVIGTLKSCTFYNTKGNLNYAYSYNYW